MPLIDTDAIVRTTNDITNILIKKSDGNNRIVDMALENEQFLHVYGQMLRIVAVEKEKELIREMKLLKSMTMGKLRTKIDNRTALIITDEYDGIIYFKPSYSVCYLDFLPSNLTTDKTPLSTTLTITVNDIQSTCVDRNPNCYQLKDLCDNYPKLSDLIGDECAVTCKRCTITDVIDSQPIDIKSMSSHQQKSIDNSANLTNDQLVDSMNGTASPLPIVTESIISDIWPMPTEIPDPQSLTSSSTMQPVISIGKQTTSTIQVVASTSAATNSVNTIGG